MNIDSAYQEAMDFAKKHYENFPVVSLLVPANLRKHVAIIYWFARTADDYADEGTLTSAERIEKLEAFENRLTCLLNGNSDAPFELALSTTISTKNLSPEYFFNLMKAFKQDVVKKSYKDFPELMSYCRNSANPVGRLILELNDIRNEEAFKLSDMICTALQLTNFWQDSAIDFNKGRIYYPQDELKEFGVTEKMFELKENNLNLKALVKRNVERTRNLFDDGERLTGFLRGRLKFEVKWTILGGKSILDRIEKNDFEVLRQRPALDKIDFFILLLKTFL